ncbi:LacI family DNA-binding transcriptional regulator [Alloscardovia omnicolens]|uniref:LacI family DNA-binding transcriptional regulator n=1 Tax=Alloscardovia omnicolens TaxID=419015 RepID=UPI003A662B0E
MRGKQPKRATLKDIAEKAGVSSTAVSLVLNNKPNRFTEETREHIRSIARELQYVPNQSARSLATQSSSLLALIIPDIENLFFASLAKHMEDECKKQGYSLLIVDTGEDVHEQSSALRRMIQLGIDGLFIVPSFGSAQYNAQLLDELSTTGIPVVFIDRIPEKLQSEASDIHMPEDAESSRVVRTQWRGLAYNHRVGGRLAARHLIEAGHTHIGVIGPVSHRASDKGDNSARFEAFLEDLDAHGIVPDTSCIIDGNFSLSVGYNHADALIRAGVTAVFCGNDLIAVGFLRRAREQGYAVPGDISLIGYDDVMGAFGLDFEFTTIRQDVAELARQSCKMMLDKNYDVQQQGSVVLLEPQLHVRHSVAQLGD